MDHDQSQQDDDVAAIRDLLHAQFRSLAWGHELEPDWPAFAQGFFPGARLFPAARPAAPQTVEQFVERMNRLRAEGKLTSFEETPLGCSVRVFGNVAVAFAACEMLENGATRTRDVSAIVLVRDGGGWHIVAQAWDAESGACRLPADLAVRATF